MTTAFADHDVLHARGDHNCVAYRGDHHRERASIDFFGHGAESDEKIIYVSGRDSSDDPVLDWLTTTIAPERLTLSHISDIYPAGGRFDGPGTVETFRGLVADARSDGWSTIRCVADLTALAASADTAAGLVSYELLIDVAIQDEGLHGLCLYDRYAVADQVPCLIATHPAHEHSTLPTATYRDDVLRLGGELDLLGLDSIVDVLANAPEAVRTVALDGLDFLDPAGGQSLWEFANDRIRRGTPVVFEGASRSVSRVLGLYGLAA